MFLFFYKMIPHSFINEQQFGDAEIILLVQPLLVRTLSGTES